MVVPKTITYDIEIPKQKIIIIILIKTSAFYLKQ